MGLRFKANLLPTFMPGETAVFFKKWIWFCSAKSFLNYRIFFSLPSLWDGAVYITNRRILFIGYLFRLINQEFDQWFETKEKLSDTEITKEVKVGQNRLLGSYLEIISENPVKHWYRSPQVCVRLYMKNAESLHKIIANRCLNSRA
jgi:hypothetical protein